MSLKSFDEFCAKVINSEPVEKEIFDERQKLVRTQITVEAFKIFTVTSCVNIVVMEAGPHWCESYVAPTALFLGIAYIYWLIRNAVKGSLFGVKGTVPMELQAGALLGESLVFSYITVFNNKDIDPPENFFVHDGMLSENFVLAVFFAMGIAAAAAIFVLAHKYKKKEETDSG